MRFTQIILAYFILGAVMWGGGVITWDQAGVGQLFVDDPTSGELNENTSEDITQAGGPIQQAASSVEGSGLIAVWGIISRFLGFLFWPMVALRVTGAPPRVWVTAGALCVVFFGALVMLFRGA
jgi:hypothetical protein